MPIKILSMKRSADLGTSWQFGGENIKYGISKLMRKQMACGPDGEPVRQRVYYQVGWDYTFEYDDDEVYFAYSLPYTYSMVTNLVH